MKKLSILGATTLAGTLLFTGVNYQTHAAESEVNVNNASSIVTDVLKKDGQSPENVNYDKPVDKGNYYFISYGNKSGYGTGGVRVYKNGIVESSSGALASADKGEFEQNGKYELSSNLNTNQTNNNQQGQNNKQNGQMVSDNKIQEQSQNEVLPETGKEDNSGLVTSIAAVLLAVGSLLTFKRLSKSYK